LDQKRPYLDGRDKSDLEICRIQAAQGMVGEQQKTTSAHPTKDAEGKGK
jgi:hypothetical protein